jgi:bifunctional UDP-N-acetylglucosamine pyrophosphorylase/glucosamine-1-phosphate N-acetyltransferase
MASRSVEGRFLVLNGDALVTPPDLRALIGRKEDIILATKELENPAGYGVVKTDGGRVARLIEKPDHVACSLVNAGIYLFPDTIFDAIGETGKSVRGEYEITDSINALASVLDIGYSMLDTWIDIGRPWNPTLNGNIRVGKGSIIRNGSYITGPVIIGENCDIGPNCFIRPGTAIGDNVRIGNAVEVKNSIVMDGTNIGHLSYVGDSVIGRGCNLGAGTKVANLRHDGRNIRAVVKGESVDTGRRKLGVIMGDGVHTGINTSINVGVMMAACMSTRPGEVLMR